MTELTRRQYILSQWDCLSFARNVLHLNIDSHGRAKSLDGQSGSSNKALSISKDVWYDHKKNVGGTVIDLCAWGMFGGDIGQAMQYLAGDFYSVEAAQWRNAVEQVTRQVNIWHEQLLPDDREYLHSRRITDETIARLHIGSMTKDYRGNPRRRLVIPYFKNGQIVYYITRDRSGLDGEAKYQKCYLPKDSQGQDAEVLQNIPWGLHSLYRKADTQSDISEYAIDKDEWLIIGEGMFDVMSFEQEGWHVLGTGGGHFSPSVIQEVIGYARDFKNVLVIFDNDGAGSQFQRDMSKKLFASRVNFFTGTVPAQCNGQAIKDVSDFYCAGGDLAMLVAHAVRGVEYLAGAIDESSEMKEFLYKAGRYASKVDMIELIDLVKHRKIFNPFWLKSIQDDCVKAPAETVIIRELTQQHNLTYLDNSGFFEYQHGVWVKTSDNQVKAFADELLGRYASNGRMTNAMKFAQARCLSTEQMNMQPIINLRNGVLLPADGCRFVQHDPAYLSTIQLPFNYDPNAECNLWESFILDVTEDDPDKYSLLQEIAGYILWPNNRLEKCFFLMGDGGNGKGVFMDTLRDVFGNDNCSALPLSSFSGNFDPIMLQYSLVNFASENRVDLRGNTERIKEVTSGNDIIAAHKGVDAVKFAPRCKLITSCNDFFNTGDITHALMRRLCFVKFNKNIVKMGIQDINLPAKLRQELPGILNWCIKGYLRLLKNERFTETQEDTQQKLEFMRTTNPVAFFIDERLMDTYGTTMGTREIYTAFKSWAEDAGYKALSLGAFTNRIKRVIREMRPDVRVYEKRHMSYIEFPSTGEELKEE